MNILVSSVGRRVQLIKYFKQELHQLHGQVLAVDCDLRAPALYHADMFEIVPRIDDPEYIDYLKQLCRQYNITAIISLIDPELALLARHRKELEKEGVTVLVSDQDVVDLCYDKFLSYTFLRAADIPVIPTYICLEKVKQQLKLGQLRFPLIVKPRKGSASIGVYHMSSLSELTHFLEQHDDYLVQPMHTGPEYSLECYVDLLTKEITSMFSKRKINMRAGETDRSVVIQDATLEANAAKLIRALQPRGPIDIDYFKTEQGYVVSEINPRLGGGYPYAHEMGRNFIKNIIHNLQGISNPRHAPYQGHYEEGETMVRYDQFVILR